jgi:hypothetical protein
MSDLDTARSDEEFTDELVRKVETEEHGTYDVHFKDGGVLLVKDEYGTRAPERQDTLRLFGRGFGYPVRGIGLIEEGVLTALYRYRTPAQEEAAHLKYVEDSNLEKQRQWTEKAEETQQRIKAMPEPFRKRFEFFMRRPEWGWNFGPYELFSCEEAIKIAAALPDAKAIEAFSKLSYDEQKLKLPGLAYGQHSGNTFAIACKLAHCAVSEPALVPKMHGALCPLAGCQEYGCWSTVARQEGS